MEQNNPPKPLTDRDTKKIAGGGPGDVDLKLTQMKESFGTTVEADPGSDPLGTVKPSSGSAGSGNATA